MLEGIPAELLNGIGVVGVVVLGALLFWRSITVVPKDHRLPRLVTGREAESYLERAEKAEGNTDTLIAAVADLTAVSKLLKAAMDARTEVQRREAEAGDPT